MKMKTLKAKMMKKATKLRCMRKIMKEKKFLPQTKMKFKMKIFDI